MAALYHDRGTITLERGGDDVERLLERASREFLTASDPNLVPNIGKPIVAEVADDDEIERVHTAIWSDDESAAELSVDPNTSRVYLSPESALVVFDVTVNG